MTYTLASATSREEVAHRIATKEALFREPDFQHPVRGRLETRDSASQFPAALGVMQRATELYVGHY